MRLPRPLLERARFLAPKDMFEAVELCLGPAKEDGKAAWDAPTDEATTAPLTVPLTRSLTQRLCVRVSVFVCQRPPPPAHAPQTPCLA